MTNVLPDPGFDQGVTGWSASRANGTVSWQQDQKNLRIECTAPDSQNGMQPLYGNWAVVSSATPGQVWFVSARIYHETGADEQFSTFVRFRINGTMTNVGGKNFTVPSGTWTTITNQVTAPAGTDGVGGYFFYGFANRNITAGEWYAVDDVLLVGQELTVTVTSTAADNGYGNWHFEVATDPPTEGVPIVLTPHAGAEQITGVTSPDHGTFLTDRNLRVAEAGEQQATVTAPGWKTGTAAWTVEQMIFNRFALTGNTLFVEGRWIQKNGYDDGIDSKVLWGNGLDESTLNTVKPYWTEGLGNRSYTYPRTSKPVTYHVILASADNISRDVTVPGTGRGVLTSADGVYTANCDVQAWPDWQFERRTSVMRIMGRREPVIVYDVPDYGSGTISLLTRTKAEYQPMLDALSNAAKFHLDTPCEAVGDMWFIAKGFEWQRISRTDGSDWHRIWHIDAVQVLET